MVVITCKNCGRMSESTTFSLDPVFGKLVCAQCVKDRKKGKAISPELSPLISKSAPQQQVQPQRPAQAERPVGWDADDEFLERQSTRKRDDGPVARRISDTHVQLTCPSCNYSYKFNFVIKHPGCCPYCSAEIPKFKLHNV